MVKPVSNFSSRIDRLPRRAQRDIKRATQILREEFAKATTGKQSEHRSGRILKIILFGSYARGRQVIDPVGRYFSDYDLLIVVDHEHFTNAARYWDKAEDRLVDMLTESGWPQPLSLIVHTFEDVNYQLRRGRYFWVDIAKDGIVLFEEPGFPLEKPGVLSNSEARLEAERYYNKNFPDIQILMDTARYQRSEAQFSNDELHRARLLNWAVFNLHQAMERSYYCIMLVMTSYSPKSHNLNFLSRRAEQMDGRLIGIWKTDTKFGKRCYELIRAAYVKARYSDYYRVNNKELDWITERVVELQKLTRIICEERILKLGDPGDTTE